jgi:HupE / UreJ protein
VALLVASAVAGAHELSRSTARLTIDRTAIDVAFTIGALDFHLGPPVDTDGDGRASADEVDSAIASIFVVLKERYRVSADGRAPTGVRLERYGLADETRLDLRLRYTFDGPVGAVSIMSALHEATQADHRHLVSVTRGDGTREAVVDQSSPTATFAEGQGSAFATLRRFVRLGLEHIVTGYDHLAFLIVLLVGASRLVDVVNIVTAFTVAHSVTLGLATFGLVTLPARTIEVLIAVSVAWVAAENLLVDRIDRRWRITFLFGLVHGFGFSNVLRDLSLAPGALAMSLFAFNLGVEIGQLAFVAVTFPLVAISMRAAWRAPVAYASSSVVLCLGVFWLVQRLLGA